MTLPVSRSVETYRHSCRRCGATWTASYEARRCETADGEQVTWFTRTGVPVSPPWGGHACTVCGGYRVVAQPWDGRPIDPDEPYGGVERAGAASPVRRVTPRPRPRPRLQLRPMVRRFP